MSTLLPSLSSRANQGDRLMRVQAHLTDREIIGEHALLPIMADVARRLADPEAYNGENALINALEDALDFCPMPRSPQSYQAFVAAYRAL